MTMNGDGNGLAVPAIVTCRSSITSSNLEQSGLGLGGRAVDLVGQQQVRENRPRPKRELAAVLLIHQLAGHVGRHEIGGELNARHLDTQRGGNSFDEQGLGDAGNTLEQHVTIGEQRRQKTGQHLLLANDDLGYLGTYRCDQVGVGRLFGLGRREGRFDLGRRNTRLGCCGGRPWRG